jgi:hypothetical protein
VGRRSELETVTAILAQDGDLLLAGVPGIGRRTLIRAAAAACGARTIEIDCLRATDYRRFLELLEEAGRAEFSSPTELALIDAGPDPVNLNGPDLDDLKAQLNRPQFLADQLNCRVVLIFRNFPHLRSWDRGGRWEAFLRAEIQRLPRVSYALIATVAECWAQPDPVQLISLGPLPAADVAPWLVATLKQQGLVLDQPGLEYGLATVQGHLGDAISLVRRLGWQQLPGPLGPPAVHQAALALCEDLAVTFESLILLLPHTQVRVLESLALDPTDRPHAKEYILKHSLSRGGTLQGALASLEQKGLVYGADLGYRITLPLLAFWLKHRLG